jgi:AbrB family looped-hinge helix DNA binding protein
MILETKVYDGNQTTIPPEIRNKFNIKPNDVVEWLLCENEDIKIRFKEKNTIEGLIGKYSSNNAFNAVEDIKKLRNGEEIE